MNINRISDITDGSKVFMSNVAIAHHWRLSLARQVKGTKTEEMVDGTERLQRPLQERLYGSIDGSLDAMGYNGSHTVVLHEHSKHCACHVTGH